MLLYELATRLSPGSERLGARAWPHLENVASYINHLELIFGAGSLRLYIFILYHLVI